MQTIPNRVELEGAWARSIEWLTHNVTWMGALVLAFFLGAAWQNGEATKNAVSSVQTQYAGKIQYHVQHEQILAKTAKTAIVACEHNLNVAINNNAGDVSGCPKAPPVVKAIVAAPATK